MAVDPHIERAQDESDPSLEGLAGEPTATASVGPAGGSIPPLHSLVAFEAIARHRAISSAARELGVTRSALSHSINLLEHRLQIRLFRQTYPSVELTRAGSLYLA